MTNEWLKGNWKEAQGIIRRKWNELTDVDMQEIAGKKDELLGKLQQKYGMAKLDAEKALAELKADIAHMQLDNKEPETDKKKD